MCHQRALALVAVAAGSANGNHFSVLAFEHFVDGVQYVLQRIWCVGIVNDGGIALWRLDWFQSSAYAVKGTHHYEHIFWLLAEHDGCTIYGEQVAHVELADKLYAHFSAVNLQIHAAEVALQDSGSEVCHAAGRVGLHGSLGVLYHDHAVLVVGIGNGKGCLRQSVEECLLGVAVVLECLVVIEMVAGEVGEQASGKLQSSDTLLCDGVRRALHEGILAASLYHLAQEHVQLDRVWGGMVGRDSLVFNVVADGREQATLMTELAEHII